MSPKRQHGLSLIELMLGITVGLFVLISASTVMIGQVSDHRRLLLETRTEQDVRAIGELIQRDLRNAGGWGNAWRSVWSESNPNPMANPYAPVTISEGGQRLAFRVSLTAVDTGTEDDVYDPNTELREYRLSNGVLRTRVGNFWQPLTDPQTLRIASFVATLVETPTTLSSVCAKPCDGLADCPPTAIVREVRVRLDAEAAHDASVKRQLDLQVRLQSDDVRGVCKP